MRPFTVLIGILAGSAASITFGLAVTLIVFGVLAGRHPDQAGELPRVLLNLFVFAALTAAASGSLLGELRIRPWRTWAHAATAGWLLLMVLWFWLQRP